MNQLRTLLASVMLIVATTMIKGRQHYIGLENNIFISINFIFRSTVWDRQIGYVSPAAADVMFKTKFILG